VESHLSKSCERWGTEQNPRGANGVGRRSYWYTALEVINQFMGTSNNSVPVTVSALTARTQLGQIMRRARRENARFVVDRRGEPQVVIMGIKDFLKTIAPEKKVLAAIRAASRKKNANKLSLGAINREIRAYRRERPL
jgi:prevent-host-death family protein